MLKYMERLLKRVAQYEVELLDMLINPLDQARLLEFCDDWSPDLIVVYSTMRDYEAILEFASQVKKKRGGVIVSVGQDATARPKSYIFENSPIDMVLPGDAEVELLSVIDRLNQGCPVAPMRDHYLNGNALTISELDELPFPECTLEELKKYYHIYPIRTNKSLVWGHIISSRGCPYPCMFCTEVIRETTGDKVRLRGAKNVVDEMEYLMDKGANIIIFDDDNFTTSKIHVKAICDEIIKRNLVIKWVAHSRVDNLTGELLEVMNESGCILLRFGIESASNRILNILEKGNQGDWIAQTKKVFRCCQDLGIGTVALFMIGSPTETKEEIEESIKFAKELQPDIIQVSFFTFYPDTKALKQFGQTEGQLEFSEMYHFSVPQAQLNLSRLDNKTLNDMQKLFYREIILNPKYIMRHIARYGLFYLSNPATFHSLSRIGRYLTGSGNAGFHSEGYSSNFFLENLS